MAPVHARRASRSWWLWFACLLGVTALFGATMLRNGSSPSLLAWLCFGCVAAAVLYQPRYGVYLIVALTLIGDISLMPWYPFTKNLSSNESILYLANSLSFSPMEMTLALTYAAWLGRMAARRKLEWYGGPLLSVVLATGAFVCFGLFYGLSRGGDRVIGLWEARALLYVPAMFVLTSNLIEQRAHVVQLMWFSIGAMFLDALSGFWFVLFELHFELGTVEQIAEHANSIQLNSLFVLLIGAWLFRASYALRLVPLTMLPILLISYVGNQRRAAFLTLLIACAVIAIVLYQRRRALVLWALPVLVVFLSIYTAAFWNSQGALGMAAQAVRSVIAPDPTSKDASSNEYRELENMNILFTIRTMPLTGIGFGHKFYIVVPMPDISFFVWWEYITHNSILWMWMKTGIGGFLAILTLAGQAVLRGSWILLRLPDGSLSAVALTAVSYVIMHFIFAYVDIAWDVQSMIYLGAMIGIINCLEHVIAKPVAVPAQRWPWQPRPAAAPGRLPLATSQGEGAH